MRWVMCCALLLAACKPGGDQSTGSIDKKDVREARAELPAAVAMHLDSGNARYRAKQYDAALAHYRAAVRIDDKEAAPWFGLYMTHLAMGHAAAADSALRKARSLAPGATILR